VAVPLTLPRSHGSVNADSTAQLVVAATRDQLLLFSFSGLEGTVQRPALTHAGHGPDTLARLRAALVEIADRRPGERHILGMFDGALPVQTVIAVLATVRARNDGSALLPEVVLSRGFR
jgi:hypothetical protein